MTYSPQICGEYVLLQSK